MAAAPKIIETSAERPRPQSALRKASFNLPVDELEELRELARARNTTATQVLRQALATESYLQGLVDGHFRLLARSGRRGALQEIVFPHMRPR